MNEPILTKLDVLNPYPILERYRKRKEIIHDWEIGFKTREEEILFDMVASGKFINRFADRVFEEEGIKISTRAKEHFQFQLNKIAGSRTHSFQDKVSDLEDWIDEIFESLVQMRDWTKDNF